MKFIDYLFTFSVNNKQKLIKLIGLSRKKRSIAFVEFYNCG